MSEKELEFGNINLLIYEEYGFLSDILSKMLNGFGIRTIHKTSTLQQTQKICEEVKAKGPQEMIDFAIIDLAPPHNHGLEFMNWLRHHDDSRLQYIPVIFTTNDTRQKIVIDSRDKGVNEVLVKPYTAYNISRRILSIINSPRVFIQAPEYCGPNRRRKEDEFTGEEKRQTEENEVEVIYEKHDAA